MKQMVLLWNFQEEDDDDGEEEEEEGQGAGPKEAGQAHHHHHHHAHTGDNGHVDMVVQQQQGAYTVEVKRECRVIWDSLAIF